MYDKFTDRARRVIVLAQEQARTLSHGTLGTEHLLLGLVEEGGGVAHVVLDGLGVKPGAILVNMAPPGTDEVTGHIPFTPMAKKSIELALREALQLGHNYVGTEHILLGILRARPNHATAALTVLVPGGSDKVRQKVIETLSEYAAAGKSDADSDDPVDPLPLSPVVEALLGIASDIPRYVTSAIDIILSGTKNEDLVKIISLADAVRKQAKKADSEPSKQPTASEVVEAQRRHAAAQTAAEVIDEKDRLRAAMGLYSWLNGEPCPDRDAYTEIAKRLWKGAI